MDSFTRDILPLREIDVAMKIIIIAQAALHSLYKFYHMDFNIVRYLNLYAVFMMILIWSLASAKGPGQACSLMVVVVTVTWNSAQPVFTD